MTNARPVRMAHSIIDPHPSVTATIYPGFPTTMLLAPIPEA
jgi:hypothetical protein